VIPVLHLLLDGLAKVRAFVTMLNQKPMARREMLAIQKEQGVAQPLCPIMGTKNR
jgi:hypothetical protein